VATTNDEDIFTTWSSDIAGTEMMAVYLCGELDASSAPSLLTDLQGLTDRKRDVIMDVHLLSYVDSTGVSALLSMRNALERAGRQMCMAGCHGVLTKIMEITRIDTRLKCFDDVDAAVAQMTTGKW
jgi:anti-sigma B factor antagonist